MNLRLALIIALTLSSCLFKDSEAGELPNIYAHTQAGMFSPAVKNALYRVYVPNGQDATVSVIDSSNYKVIETFATGKEPQHVVPSYDLKTVWVLNNQSNTLTAVNPETGNPIKTVSVDDPYNLYFTPDGKFAIVVCEAKQELQFRDPQTMKLLSTLPTRCEGANHMEFTVDGKFAIITCEFSARLMKIDVINQKVIDYLSLDSGHPQKISSNNDIIIGTDGKLVTHTSSNNATSMPQDIRSSPDGSVFFVADMLKDGLVLIDPVRFKRIGFIPTGIGTHAVYPSRDGKLFYVSNRGCHHTACGPHGPGTISVIDPIKRAAIAKWIIPEGGSPDMGNISADGKELWLSGRYDNEVYVFDTTSGKLTHRIPVGKGPHGLAVWPQPGQYSLGHTGNMR